MAYIRIDLDGKKKWPLVAQGIGVPRANVAQGFSDLYELVFNEKQDTVSILQLECMFGAPGTRVGQVLEAFRFLEFMPDIGLYRVRGSEEYLKVGSAMQEGAKRGGASTAKSGKGLQNLKQNRPKPTQDEAKNTEASPRPNRGLAEPLPEAKPSSLHQAPNTNHQAPIDSKPPNPLSGEAAAPADGQKELSLPLQEPKRPTPEDEVMAYYLEAVGAALRAVSRGNIKPKDTAHGRSLITDRLTGRKQRDKRKHSVADCKMAIDGLTWSDHHLTGGFHGIKYALRSSEQMDGMIDRIPADKRSA